MAKKKPTKALTKIPERDDTPTQKQRRGKDQVADDAGPDLSHIWPGLRGMVRRTDCLQFHPKNPNRHNEKNIAALAASMKLSGQYVNLVASTRTDPPTVVMGNGRLAAALSLGWAWIACECKEMAVEEENRHLVIDNAWEPDWERDLLREAYESLSTGHDEQIEAMLAELAKDEKLWPDDEPENDDDAGDAAASQGGKDELRCPNCGHKWEA